jgi:phosphoglycolate phosphatase
MIKTVLFDFDYTLADSSEAVVECFNTALVGIGLEKAPADAICRTIGLSIPESLARVAGEAHLPRAEEFRLHWRRRSDEVMVEWTRMFDYTPGAIEELRAAGLALGIVSTKWRSRILSTLERNGLQGRFDVIVGGEDVENHKPHPEGLLTAAARLSASQEEVLYVGDTVADARAAEAAGMKFVAVLSGMTREAEFGDFPRAAVLDNVGGLPELLRTADTTGPAFRAAGASLR